MKKSALIAGFALLASTSLGGCTKPVMSDMIAERLASAAYMKERLAPAGPFNLTTFERMHKRNAPADVYIEGDGKAWVSRKRPSLDPTPVNPLALHLATRDNADNVAYLARPCQYSKLQDKEEACDIAYWTNRRFSPEVIDAYNKALDEMKKRYDLTGFNLIGFSGGGAVAAILAGQREDVLTLRTVAGNLDHRFHSAYHKVSYLEGSLNPPDFAARLAQIPQVHFIGGQDTVIPPAIVHSYLEALGPGNCAQVEMVQEASHDAGWVEKWPTLMRRRPTCSDDIRPAASIGAYTDVTGYAPMKGPVYTAPESPEKP